MLDIRWVKLHSVKDDRGCLTAIEGAKDVPFDIQRVFYMHDVVPGSNRGGHAHRDTDQLAVAVHGSMKLTLSDGETSVSIVLDDPAWGVTLPCMTWTRLYDFTDGGVCMVLASTQYQMRMSIRDWPSYLEARGLSARPEPMTGHIITRPAL
ncbi:FdtA/QdtA family cupin domain-containing protein [bacterium]|nr:FdtA/QdtA family cupin domain-containing protein [bacterium]